MAQLKGSPARRAKALALEAAGTTVGTDIVYELQPGRWTPERLQIQKAILDDLFASLEDSEAGVAELPIAVLLLGLPGSGKSTALKPVAQELTTRIAGPGQLTIDADVVRCSLPEYCEGHGSEVVQVETAFLTYQRLVERAIATRCHLILDMVGDPVQSVRDVEYLTDAGWTVGCICASVEVDVAVQRAQLRALATGRFVPPEYIRDAGDRPVEAYHAVAESGVPLIGGALLDTSGRELEAPVVKHTDNIPLFGEIGQPTKLWPSSAGSTTEAQHARD